MWLIGQLGVDPRDGMDAVDWLAIPQQQLLGVVGGAVYADPDGDLETVRDLLGWYPPDVWLWLLASQWRRIFQEIAFIGRAAEVGDNLGSMIIAGRLVRELMRLCFLQNRTYWPYTKWFGSAFARLPDVDGLKAALDQAVSATDYPTREAGLVGGVQDHRAAAERSWYHRAGRLVDRTVLLPTVPGPARVLRGGVPRGDR